MRLRFPPRCVLVAADLTLSSTSALAAGRAFSEKMGAALEVVFVEEPAAPVALDEGLTATVVAAAERAREERRDAWRAVVSDLLAGVKPAPQLVVVHGEPAAVLAARAVPRRCDLVVMGSEGRSGARRFLLGSVAEAVVHRAGVPVLVVRAGAALGAKRVLVPCHMRRYADRALAYGMETAAALGAPLTILYVPAAGTWDLDAELQLRAHVERRLGAKAAKAADVVIRHGDPREQIAREADTGRYGLLVLSAHQRAELADLAVGSTAERMIRRCALPILTVPAPVARPAAPTLF